jgi:hypothetical protein
MVQRSLIFSLLLSLPLIWSGCDNEIDLLDDYREIPVIYGLVNPASTTHQIRVQRAFLGEGNALLMAQYPDSSYYDTSSVRLTIEKIVANQSSQLGTFYPYYGLSKDEGLFTDQNHYVFRLDNYRLQEDENVRYRLKFENLATGKIVTAETRVIRDILQGTLSSTTRVNLASTNPYNIRITTPRYGRQFGMIMRIRYTEKKKITQITTSKYLDLTFPPLLSRTQNGGEELIFLVDGKKVFQFLGQKIKTDTTVVRRLQDFKADYLFTAVTEDFFNYVQVNAPSNAVNFIPEFTNLSDGKGLFTCRLDTVIPNIIFNEATYDSLANGTYTRHIFQ